jgi:tRNA(Ile2)-agmatinylcytidine synthase
VLLTLDDTDGPQGGCTTYAAACIADRLGPDALDGRPRLVRLDPDNPWKTRGNAAVAIPLSRDLHPETVLETAAGVVDDHARIAEGKGAGLAVLSEPPAPAWYERGVRERVGLDEARSALADVPTWTAGTGRGLVGCLCAAAWRPGPSATYTRIAYRHPEARGTSRAIDARHARELDTHHEAVFDAYDAREDHALVAPRTPGPLLLGLRASEPDDLADRAARLAEEPIERAYTFVTNQASDDHLAAASLQPLVAADEPQRLEGGHVRLATRTPREAERTVLAFEPTGDLRTGLRAVEPGDRLLALGSLKDAGRQVNLEKLFHVPADRTQAPACPGCGGRPRSIGHEAGYRCPRCGTRQPGETSKRPPRWHEADPSARRHLARPLALGLAPRVQAAKRACLAADRPRPQATSG